MLDALNELSVECELAVAEAIKGDVSKVVSVMRKVLTVLSGFLDDTDNAALVDKIRDGFANHTRNRAVDALDGSLEDADRLFDFVKRATKGDCVSTETAFALLACVGISPESPLATEEGPLPDLTKQLIAIGQNMLASGGAKLGLGSDDRPAAPPPRNTSLNPDQLAIDALSLLVDLGVLSEEGEVTDDVLWEKMAASRTRDARD